MMRKPAGGAEASGGSADTERHDDYDDESAPALAGSADAAQPSAASRRAPSASDCLAATVARCAGAMDALLGGGAAGVPQHALQQRRRRRRQVAIVVCAVLAVSALLAASAALASDDDAGPRWRVAVCKSWAPAERVLGEMHVLDTAVRRATRGAGALTPTPYDCDGWWGVPRGVDVVIFGPYGSTVDGAVAAAKRLEGRAVRLFLGSEPWPGYDDGLAGHMDVSLGHRRDVDHPAYLRMPWWLPYSVAPPPPPPAPSGDGSGAPSSPTCAFLPALRASPDPEAWAARAGDASLLSSHTSYPRPQLYELVTGSGRAVAAPGKAFHNTEWPPELPNSHLTGKVDFLARYRYNVCPENARTGAGGGYATEKLPQAHMAGAVPLYWGDPLDTAVWNPDRVLTFNGTNSGDLLAVMDALERDRAYRAAWFARPALAPGADGWLDAWCDDAGARLVAAHAKLLEARRRRREARWAWWPQVGGGG
jgi:hypothetical protein